MYTIDNVGGMLFVLFMVALLSFLIIIIVYGNDSGDATLFFIPMFFFIVGVIVRFSDRYKFDSISNAKIFITKKIEKYNQKTIRKEKRKNKKIHYIDIKTERKIKLKSLNEM